MAERAQSLILLCKVETRSSIDNLLNINVALMSTLHNDMLVIIQKLDLKSSSVNFKYVNADFDVSVEKNTFLDLAFLSGSLKSAMTTLTSRFKLTAHTIAE